MHFGFESSRSCGCFAFGPELSLELYLTASHCFATDHARLTASGTPHDAVRTSRRQLPILDRFEGLLAKGVVVHQ